jgi:fermentation-respiration switch protein FrsA (DUF1100 family)
MCQFLKKVISNKKFKISVLVLSAIYIGMVLFMYLNQQNLLYHPEREKYGLAHYKITNAEEITLTSDDGTKLQAWYRKPDHDCDMTVFLHGNAGSLDDRADKLKELADMGYGFIIPAWRGFGESEGSPSMEGIYNDARAAIKFAESKGYQTEDMVLIGESLGSGIATKMATEFQFKGLFLITPYTSIADRASEMYPFMPVHNLTKDNFSVIDKIATIKQPLLIIHGTNDLVIPHSHSEKIISVAIEPKKLVLYPDIGHVNYDIKAVFTQMKDFFGMCVKKDEIAAE